MAESSDVVRSEADSWQEQVEWRDERIAAMSESYALKCDDLRRETVRTSMLRNIVWRLLHVIPRGDLDAVLADGFATPEEMAVLRDINEEAPVPWQ